MAALEKKKAQYERSQKTKTQTGDNFASPLLVPRKEKREKKETKDIRRERRRSGAPSYKSTEAGSSSVPSEGKDSKDDKETKESKDRSSRRKERPKSMMGIYLLSSSFFYTSVSLDYSIIFSSHSIVFSIVCYLINFFDWECPLFSHFLVTNVEISGSSRENFLKDGPRELDLQINQDHRKLLHDKHANAKTGECFVSIL